MPWMVAQSRRVCWASRSINTLTPVRQNRPYGLVFIRGVGLNGGWAIEPGHCAFSARHVPLKTFVFVVCAGSKCVRCKLDLYMNI